jgi:hypothetical protein
MRQFHRSLVGVLLGIVVLIAIPPPAHAQNCTFVLGFATLHGMIPTISGDCVDNEMHGANGDGLQNTVHGLMVWRKADNFTAFTNGSTTWINGPFGLQTRPNNLRFTWEVDDAKVSSTQVITFTTPTTATKQATGNCFAPSVAATRSDAFRCIAGNAIFDPCFTIPGNTSAVMCVPDPTDPTSFVQLSLTQPLPAPQTTPAQPQPWFLKLADNSTCGFLTGATGAVNGQRLNYGCTSTWDLLGMPQRGTVWTIPAVLLAPNSLDVQSSATAEIATAWV